MKRWMWLLLLALLLTSSVPSVAAQVPGEAVSVYYIGPQDTVLAAIRRAAPHVLVVDNPELAKVYILNDPLLEPEQLQRIGRLVLREEVGLVLFLGPHFPRMATEMRALLGVGTFSMAGGITTPQRVRKGPEPDPLQTVIAWNSAPEIQARSVISNPNLLLPVVTTVSGQPLIQRGRGRERYQVFVVGPWFADPTNAPWVEWPYFDYLMYRLVAEAAAVSRPIAFADYPRAPVPQGPLRRTFNGIGIAILMLCLLVLFFSRREFFLHPERWQAWRFPLQVHPVGWHSVGFHRPLAGLLLLLGIAPLLLIPWLIFGLQLLPQVLLPWQQTRNFWEQTGQWLGVLWLVFDAGVDVAAVWYFTAWRGRNPKEGFRYLQLYIWWQIVSGAVQVILVLGAVHFVLLRTTLAHLAFYILARILLQFPGFLMVFRIFFRAEQRFDYVQRLVVVQLMGTMGLQLLLVLLQRTFLPTVFNLDASSATVLSLGLALYLAEWLTFGMGLWWYQRSGYSLYALFMPAFDWGIVTRALHYGLRWVGGPLVGALTALLQGQWLAQWLPNVEGFQAAWPTLAYLLAAFGLLQIGLYESLMPTLVEAITQEARTLVRYYTGQALRYGLWTALPILAVMALIGERLDAGWLEGRYTGLAPFLGLLLTWAALQAPARTAERLLEAEGRPGLRSLVLIVEQVARLVLIPLLTPRWAFMGFWAALMLGLALRTGCGWLLVRRWRVKFNLWQMVIAPAGAALIIYNVGEVLQSFISVTAAPVAQVLWFVLLLLLLPLYGFLTGLLGGWDDGGLEELRQALRLSDLGWPFAALLWGMVTLGARFSPLHGAFPMALYVQAREEAQALSMRRPLNH